MQKQDTNLVQRIEMDNNPSTANQAIDAQALLKRMDALSFIDQREKKLRQQIEKLNAKIQSTTLAYEREHHKQLLKAKELCDELESLQKKRT
ncbi:hypothetical protein [Helicobacter suis]|uniref:hypothetical protein n=2 Tax=Helicobacter suis TaxID=104628 RepID=UPI0013D4B955|nr:hypothetical protein [Helicobacter suis]